MKLKENKELTQDLPKKRIISNGIFWRKEYINYLKIVVKNSHENIFENKILLTKKNYIENELTNSQKGEIQSKIRIKIEYKIAQLKLILFQKEEKK